MFSSAEPKTSPPRLAVSSEVLILCASVFWTLALNRGFFAAALRTPMAGAWSSAAFAGALAATMVALHVLLLGVLGTRRTLKPLLALLTIVGVLVMHYTRAYNVIVDPSMMRNALHTDVAETRELLSWRLAGDLLLYALLPIALLLSVRVEPRPWALAWRARLRWLAAAALVFALGLIWQFQALASMMRNHKETRYLLTPLNAVWSMGSVLAAEARGAATPRQAIGLDATPGPSWRTQDKPRLVVMVVGETARAANWGLSGYARQTTPQLAQLPVVNFTEVSACGTSTEVSLPCMFAPVGRRRYDEAAIRGSESLLHVVARAGVAVHWRDNQSGCKGVCEGLPRERVNAGNAPGLCHGDRCLDEGLLRGLPERLRSLAGGRGTHLLVLHMLGNHGPSYFRRYPAGFERFTPVCAHDDLGSCSRDEIVNAYDNALLYTDHVLATLIKLLDAHAGEVDSAVLYISDHGESLGEKGLFLHGVPYAIAPREQTQVPMVFWSSSGFARGAALDGECLRARARAPASHDHLFHTLLGLLDVQTALYEQELDFTRSCLSTH
jgi:lipid A ethanolaminephosphotransferase